MRFTHLQYHTRRIAVESSRPSAAGNQNLALRKPATQSSISQWSTRSIRLPVKSTYTPQENTELGRSVIAGVQRETGASGRPLQQELDALCAAAPPLADMPVPES